MKAGILSLALVLLASFAAPDAADTPEEAAGYQRARTAMVAGQVRARGIRDPQVLAAMADVPRHLFVPPKLKSQAYADRPLPIGEGQTISQPYIVALMTESLMLQGHEVVLEIGTGSGYQAAVLARIVRQVNTVEIIPGLHASAARRLDSLNVGNVSTRNADGYFGWESAAPFDCIMITAAIDHIPLPLLKQLRDGGRLILPLGNPFNYQNLVLVTKQKADYTVRQITGVLFVPMTGYALQPKK